MNIGEAARRSGVSSMGGPPLSSAMRAASEGNASEPGWVCGILGWPLMCEHVAPDPRAVTADGVPGEPL